MSHFKLDNLVSKEIALFLFATRHVYKRPGKCHSLVLREILLYNMKIFKGNIGGKGGARCPRWDFPLHLFSLVASSGRWHRHAENILQDNNAEIQNYQTHNSLSNVGHSALIRHITI